MSDEAEPLPHEVFVVADSDDSPTSSRVGCSEVENKHELVSEAHRLDTASHFRAQTHDEDWSPSTAPVPSGVRGSHRHSPCADTGPRHLHISNTEILVDYYDTWKPVTGSGASVDREWESGTTWEKGRPPANSRSPNLHRVTSTASENTVESEAKETRREGSHLQTIEQPAPQADTCESNDDEQRQTAADKQAPPVVSGRCECLDAIRSNSPQTYPGFSLRTSGSHEETPSRKSSLTGTDYQRPHTRYFAPAQQSHPVDARRPLRSHSVHPLDPPLQTEKPLTFLMPPLSPAGRSTAPNLTPCQTLPSSPRALPGNLFCCSVPSSETAGAHESVVTSEPVSPSDQNLTAGSFFSPFFEEPGTSHCSVALVDSSAPLADAGKRATEDESGREEVSEAVAEQLAEETPCPVPQDPRDSVPNKQRHAAADTLPVSRLPAEQQSQLVEAADADETEQKNGEEFPRSKTSANVDRSNNSEIRRVSLSTCESTTRTNRAGTVAAPYKSHDDKEIAPLTAKEAGTATEGALWLDTSTLTHECVPDGNLIETREIIKQTAGTFARPPAPAGANISHYAVCASALLPTEIEELPPFLLGRNTLTLPLKGGKAESHTATSSAEPSCPTEVFLREHPAQGLASTGVEPPGVPRDSKTLQESHGCRDWPQQRAALASPPLPFAADDLGQPVALSGSSLPLLFPQPLQQPVHYACASAREPPEDLAVDSAVATTQALSRQAPAAAAVRQEGTPDESEEKALQIVGAPTTLLASCPFAILNAFCGASRQLVEPAAGQPGHQISGLPSALPCPLLPSPQLSNLPASEAAALAALNCGLPLPLPWLSETSLENGCSHAESSADSLQPQAQNPSSPSPLQPPDATFCISPVVPAPSLYEACSTKLLLPNCTQTHAALESLNDVAEADEATAATLSFEEGNTGVAEPHEACDSEHCSLGRTTFSRKRRLMPSSAPPESAPRDHKDILLELLAGSLEPVKGVHMDRLRKTWVASWLVGKRRVTRIFSFQKFGFFGAREQAIRQRREALLNPELESEEAQRIVAAAAAAAAEAVALDASAVCTAAGAAERHSSNSDLDLPLVQKIADSLPFVVGVTYHGESFSWIANHRKPMGKIVARRRFNIAEYGFLEARRRAAVMMFHWHKQGRIVEPEDYDHGAAAVFNAQQRPQLPDPGNSEGFVYWHSACTADEPLYLMAPFDEESCDEAMVFLASICGNPWKRICRGQLQAGSVDELLLSAGETAATTQLLSTFHSEGACTNWYLSNSERRERNNSFWEGIKMGKHNLNADAPCALPPRKRHKCSTAPRKVPQARKYVSAVAQQAQPLKSVLAGSSRGALERFSKRQTHVHCKTLEKAHEDEEEEELPQEDGCWEGKIGGAGHRKTCSRGSVQTASYTKTDVSIPLKHHVLASTRRNERSRGIRKQATPLQYRFSAARISPVKESAPSGPSTYWTRRKQAELRARIRDEIDTLVHSEGAPHGSKGAAYTAATDGPRKSASAQDVLRACFGSASASAICTAAASHGAEEADALLSQPASAEADDTEAEADEEDDMERLEEEEDAGENDNQDELFTTAGPDVGSLNTFHARRDTSKCRKPQDVRSTTLRHTRRGRPPLQSKLRDVLRAESVVISTACDEEERRSANVSPKQEVAYARPIDAGGAPPYTQLVETTSWFTDSFVQNATLSQEQQEQVCRESSEKELSPTSVPPPYDCGVGSPPLCVFDNSSAPLWASAKEV